MRPKSSERGVYSLPMTADDFRLLALQIPGSTEAGHMGHPDFRCKGRIFASLGYPEEGWGMVKLTPAQQRSLVRKAPRIFHPANGAWGKSGSTIIHLKPASKAIVKAALSSAFSNVQAAKKHA